MCNLLYQIYYNGPSIRAPTHESGIVQVVILKSQLSQPTKFTQLFRIHLLIYSNSVISSLEGGEDS